MSDNEREIFGLRLCDQREIENLRMEITRLKAVIIDEELETEVEKLTVENERLKAIVAGPMDFDGISLREAIRSELITQGLAASGEAERLREQLRRVALIVEPDADDFTDAVLGRVAFGQQCEAAIRKIAGTYTAVDPIDIERLTGVVQADLEMLADYREHEQATVEEMSRAEALVREMRDALAHLESRDPHIMVRSEKALIAKADAFLSGADEDEEAPKGAAL